MNSSPALIISTCDQPDYLSRVLRAVATQTQPVAELTVADDGSGPETKSVVDEWAARQPFPCRHVWQEKSGFRKSRVLNIAVAGTRADYVVFLDGDTVPHPDFVADHQSAARAGFFTQGHRALIERKAAAFFGKGDFPADRRRALFSGQLKGWKHAYRWPFALAKARADLRGVRGCNFALWRRDFEAVNGYNEAFVGWGREDSELAVRLMNSGVRRLDLRGRALCYHLWHPPASRAGLVANDRMLEEAIATKSTRCQSGFDQHKTRPA
jgi:glycosyltransferase involved in cell wall biosynthesis